MSITIIDNQNAIDIERSEVLSKRRSQLKKLTNAIGLLDYEIKVLSTKCDQYVGDNCNETCFNITNNNASVCTGNGKCVEENTCQCNGNWTGSNCNIYQCPPNSSAVCSSSTGPCTCICKSGYGGINCTLIEIVGNDSVGRKYGDSTYASSCYYYLYPSKSNYRYSGSVGNGYYWIKPDSTPINVYCEMTAKGGGWTALTSEVISSTLNTGPQPRNYLYAKDSNNWVYTPATTNVWNRLVYNPMSGNYYYSFNNGATENFFSCTSVSDGIPAQNIYPFAVGCSNGPGTTSKVVCSQFSEPHYCSRAYFLIVSGGIAVTNPFGGTGTSSYSGIGMYLR